jgi:hypothetical protein
VLLLALVVGAIWLVSTLLGGSSGSSPSQPLPSQPTGVDAADALGDRSGPFPDTTALAIVELGERRGVLSADVSAVDDPELCAEYPGCRSAATAGDISVVVFESSDAAQSWRDGTAEGSEAESAGGRRYWAYVDYLSVDDPDVRSAWRDVLRAAVPAS